ncbi:Xaa-Pro peptidase family protein [Comamonadaceae bacterium G21597-S1]|nr:Xaa-Pro peptidase family protein [Comamonadaceae bacterium G21597-S1]
MSKRDFSLEEFASRRRKVRQAMREQQLDWLVLIHPVCIHWLTGSDAKSYQEFQCLLLAADDASPLTMLTRAGEYNEFVQDALVDVVITYGGGENEDPVAAFVQLAQRLGLPDGRVGMEVPAYYLHPHHYLGIREALGASLVAEPTHLVHDLKLVKSPAELDYIRQAVAKADAAMTVFAAALQVGRSELAVAGTVVQALMARDSALAASPINLVSGERSCFSHGAPTERKLRAGDVGNVEFGATHRRYTATIGRNFSIGAPGARMRELHDLVCRASDACMARIRDGVPAAEPHAAAKEVIAQAGLEHCRVHLTGYGLAPGFPPGWGEPIHMLADSRYTLRAGMVLSVEPPVFIGAEGLGARIIDNVLVTLHGCEILSRFSRDLIVADP